jgi:predicted GNAT superfamily acetyltransferase
MSERPKWLPCDPVCGRELAEETALPRAGEGRHRSVLFGALPHALLCPSRLVPGADGAQAGEEGVMTMHLRHVRASDCDRVVAVIDEWWGGPAAGSSLPQVFFSHLTATSFALEASDGVLVGFLLGFLLQTHPDEACAHMIGAHPESRRLGLGRRLCERFFVTAQMNGRRYVRAVSPPSSQAVAFHVALGFTPMGDEDVTDSLTGRQQSTGTGGHRIVFRRGIAHDAQGVPGPGEALTE